MCSSGASLLRIVYALGPAWESLPGSFFAAAISGTVVDGRDWIASTGKW
jgi:hypothetical protein